MVSYEAPVPKSVRLAPSMLKTLRIYAATHNETESAVVTKALMNFFAAR